MKKLNFLITLLFISCVSVLAQVTGNAKLIGATDHSGIKVVFTAVSLTAKTDSTVTDSFGNYSKNLTAGTYAITFAKSGYHLKTYTESVFVNGSKPLANIVLTPTNVVYVSGEVSGNWDKDHIYIVSGWVAIREHKTLNIEPGTKIYITKLPENSLFVGITFEGKLTMNGTEKDSIYIYEDESFKKEESTLYISINSCDTLEMNYLSCHADNLVIDIPPMATNPLCLENYLHISNSCFEGLSAPLNTINIDIHNNKSKQYASFNIISNKEYPSKTNVACNHFKYSRESPFPSNSNRNALSMMGTSLIYKSNIFEFTDAYIPSDFIIGQESGVSLSFENNLIINYTGEIMIYDKREDGSFKIENNTILNKDTTHFSILLATSRLSFKNNILSNVRFDAQQNTITGFTHNQFTSGSTFGNLPGAGIPIAQNSQGSDIDTYLNVVEDPNFSTAPLLKSTSPMIGAGINGSNIGFDPKGTCLESFFKDSGEQPSADTLTISGQIFGENGEIVSATVTAINKNTQKEYSVTTDFQAVFELKSLPNGPYLVKAVPTNEKYLTTYFPKKTIPEAARTVSLTAHISDMKIYLVSFISGIVDAEINAQVYPNPFDDELIIKNSAISTVLITDLTGREVYSDATGQHKINTSAWQKGIYMVKIGQSVSRFVKN